MDWNPPFHGFPPKENGKMPCQPSELPAHLRHFRGWTALRGAPEVSQLVRILDPRVEVSKPAKSSGWWLTYPSEKYESVGMIIPNTWENKKCSKPPTSVWLEPVCSEPAQLGNITKKRRSAAKMWS